MAPFRPLAQHELERLDDDALIAYMRSAARAGDPSAQLALAMLAWGHRENVRRRVVLKVPPQDVEDLTDEILAKALTSAFDGDSGARFGAWMNTIARRAIADYHRRGPGRLATAPLEVGDAPAPADHAVEVEDALARVLASLNPDHRRVVERWLEGYGTADVPEVSADNFHQIASRFRRALRGQLGAGPNGEGT